MDPLNWIAIIAVTVVNFVFGHLWFGPLFGKKWQKIHGVDCNDKAQMKKMMEGLWKIMVSELVATFLLMTGLAWMINATAMNITGAIQVALWVWGFFVLPITVSNVVWGGDKKSDMPAKITITVLYRLIPMILAGYVFIQF